MDSRVLDSIVEITKQRDSDALGISILATIAELVPSCFICLYKVPEEFPKSNLQLITSLQAKKDNDGIKQYIWDLPIPYCDSTYLQENRNTIEQFGVYQSSDKRHHIFMPIVNESKIVYGLDISSNRQLNRYVETLLAIGKVCENFYAILSASEKDTLTGLLNRKTYEQKLTALLNGQQHKAHVNKQSPKNKRQKTHQDHTWLAIFDIDFFKKVNDQYGHLYGDEVLLVLSQLMKANFRENDLMFRFGGEEFVVIFEPITKAQAQSILLTFMANVEKHVFPMVGNITISCGFAKISKEDHPKVILDYADKALYYAKEHGRNCLYNFETLLEQGEIELPNIEGDIELF